MINSPREITSSDRDESIVSRINKLDDHSKGPESVIIQSWQYVAEEHYYLFCTRIQYGGGGDFIECFTTTCLRAHSWLNWVDEDDDEGEVGLKEKPGSVDKGLN